MKKILLLFLFFGYIGFGQTKGISYQALILDPINQELPGVEDNKAPLADKNICLKFAIIDEFNTIEYEEIFTTKTDNYGMVNLIIGTETKTGGYASSFEDIKWSTLPKNLKIDLSVDPSCSNFSEISNAPFTAVPFALFAINSQNMPGTTGAVMLSGDQAVAGIKTFSDPIFGNLTGDVTGDVTGNAATATKIASITNGNIVQLTDTQTLTNKTLTSPTITGTGAIAGTFTGDLTGDVTGDLTGDVTGNAATATKIASITNSNIVQLTETQTLTNKTLTSPTITGTGAIAGTFTGDVTGNVTGDLNGTINTATTATTQTAGDNSTKVATTEFVNTEIAAGTATNVSGVVGVSNGGTGASSAAVARNNLGIYAFRITLIGGTSQVDINLTYLISKGHLPSGYIFTGNEIITATLNEPSNSAISAIFPADLTLDPDLDVLRITSVGGDFPSGQVSIIIIP